jgi:hypothetical protein
MQVIGVVTRHRCAAVWHVGLALVFCAVAANSAGAQLPAGDPAPAPLRIAKPILAAWSFDERGGGPYRDASGNGYDASPAERARAAVASMPGVFGRALALSGVHAVQVRGRFSLRGVERLSFSAWVMPSELSGYREIFRKEDGDARVLLSFQDNGTHLSLGLNINGYEECDAPIDPADVLDNAWHHCAATFDGAWMRVYLDGREIGRLKRSGKLRAGGPAAAFIGSSSGGECFQGGLDELVVYREALTAGEVRSLWQNGSAINRHNDRDATVLADSLYASGGNFAATLAGCRRKLQEQSKQGNPSTVAIIARRLRSEFREEYFNFTRWSGINPIRYLTASDNAALRQAIERLLEMALEYKPLTAEQWKHASAEDRRSWEAAEATARKFAQLERQGDAARFAPGWIEIVLEAGPLVHERPRIHEPVAPYVRPDTPETRTRTAAEGQAALRRDWLHQTEGHVTAKRISAEIGWTRQIIARIKADGQRPVDFTAETARLAELEQQAAKVADDELYYRVRQVKRAVMFKNPAIDFQRVLLVDAPFPQGSEWMHETRHRLGYMAVPGGKLVVLDGLAPDGTVRQLMPQAPLHGSFWRPDLSFDGRRVVFCFKPHNEKAFHLYQINIDGSELVQLTAGIYDDLDPIYLPDGHILFCTTRGHTYVRCMPPTNAFSLARCDADGKNIYLVSYNNEPDYLPSVMDDGRVLYTRRE